MQILSLKQNKDKSIYATTDIGLNFRLSINSIAKFNIFQGKLITEEEIREIQSEEKRSALLQLIIEYIAIRPRSTREISDYIDKILKRKFKLEKIGTEELLLKKSLIEYLIEKKYVDDFDFAKWWINNRVDFKNMSKKAIKYELLKKGISENLIEENLTELYSEEDEKTKIQNIILKKYKGIVISELNPKDKQKIISFLYNKGYNYELIKEIIQ